MGYEERQAVLAQLLGATVFGMMAGQWAGGVLAQVAGWRLAFVALAAIFLACGTLLRPKSGDCCVFCSYGTVPCPPIQQHSPCCNPPG